MAEHVDELAKAKKISPEALSREDLSALMGYRINHQRATQNLATAEELLNMHVKYLKAAYDLGDGDDVNPKTGIISRAVGSGGNP